MYLCMYVSMYVDTGYVAFKMPHKSTAHNGIMLLYQSSYSELKSWHGIMLDT